MQERLLQMGAWLKIIGEAIYNTKIWEKPFQWSSGEQNYKPKQHYLGGDFILKQTIDQEPGYAVKEFFFTQNKNAIFLISPKWPNKEFIVKDLELNRDQKITLLATGEQLKWKQSGKNLIVISPEYQPNKMKETDTYAFVFKITK